MDRRYKNLSLEQLDEWFYGEARRRRLAELCGWFEGDAEDVGNLRQVLGLSYRLDADGQRSDIFLEMMGVASDVIPESEWDHAGIRTWYGRFLMQLKDWVGVDRPFSSIRPKRMTFEPMQRLHDYVPTGLTIRSDDEPGAPSYALSLDEQHDKGDAVFWRMRVVRVSDFGF